MIGKNINVLRKRKGLSLSDLSHQSGISKSYLSNIERSLNQNPSIQILEKVASVLKVDLNVLLESDNNFNKLQQTDQELVDFISELKKSGIEKDNIQEYRQLIEFINWQNQNIKLNNN
ncbi:helix-turn-helix domain-containing protein [Mesobacillus foraminis]|uniref:XRE family transcriptional regulator of biofilm formation n=1 Tax=Mesobacillus foraminis TaxID=279826 RepID=A0A4R2B985_9BACI|nr:helix-turn-helix transcriptional regulator [Mesobacillus foraminis]TCN22194.1 XRE family transcriptional regulator of biofilm formation [Mesobacillus foraminis]